MNSPFSCYFLDLGISFPGLRFEERNKNVFSEFRGESETVPEKKKKK